MPPLPRRKPAFWRLRQAFNTQPEMDTVPSFTAMHIENPRPSGLLKRFFRYALLVSILGFFLLLTVIGGLYLLSARDLPELDAFDKLLTAEITRFHASDGSIVAERYLEKRIAVSWEETPKQLALAFLAAEDGRFFEHDGLDYKGILRAMVTNLSAGGIKEGGSTITQQLVKRLVGSDRTYTRKIKEAILARRLEAQYSKAEILTWYMNAVYLGHGSYGIKAAAQNYFRKNLWELSLPEMAMLAGCAQSPSRVNPARDLEASELRTAYVLRRMKELGWASEEQVKEALHYDYRIYPLQDVFGGQMPDYTSLASRWLKAQETKNPAFGDYGLRVELAGKPAAQRLAHQALSDALIDLQKKQGYPGPLAHYDEGEKAAFFQRSKKYLDSAKSEGKGKIQPGSLLLAYVDKVEDKSLHLALSKNDALSLSLKNEAWATPWSVQDLLPNGRRNKKQVVSFNARLKSFKGAFKVGDIALIEVGDVDKAAKKATKSPENTHYTGRLVPVPMMEGALASMPLGMGSLDAIAGGWDFDRSEVDRSMALRQIGSLMKPMAYALAYDMGYPPSTLISGAPFREGNYNPTAGSIKDDSLAWLALAKSDNSAALRVLQYVLKEGGLEKWQEWGKTLGFSRDFQGNTAEVLGADQRLRDVLAAFGIFANEGKAHAQNLVRKVITRDGRILYREQHPLNSRLSLSETALALSHEALHPKTQVISPSTAYLISENLKEVVEIGTGRKAKELGVEVAGKTGTLAYDVWFSGFSQKRVTAAWIGADRRERTLGPSERNNKVYGATAALPMWLSFMKGMQPQSAQNGREPINPFPPKDIEFLQIDKATGLLARPLPDGTYNPKESLSLPHKLGTGPYEMVKAIEPEPSLEDLESEF